MIDNPHSCACQHCARVSRRGFLRSVGSVTAASLALGPWDLLQARESVLPQRGPVGTKPLVIQPVLTYDTPVRHQETSWRGWGGIHNDAQAEAEKTRIEADLAGMKDKAGFPLEFRPLVMVRTVEQAGRLTQTPYEVLLLYAAGGGGDILETLTVPGRWNIMFLRHDPGPVYLWYEIVHPRFLRKTVDDYGQPGWDVDDVVVDENREILWRLRSLAGLKNALNKRMVCIGGASGWGKGGQAAPQIAKDQWKMDLVDYPYEELSKRILQARENSDLVGRCAQVAGQYLKRNRTSLETSPEFVDNAFVLTEVFKDILEEAQTDALTVNNCMGTIMGMSQTTACLPLSLLNDDGFLAFCESDFVVIPSGVLLHYISGLPVFLNDPTTPHDDMVTLAHCTAPRKMDGHHREPARILTHFESDYGAAPKVQMKVGQVCTNLVPDFASQKWVGFRGTIIGNPFLDICRSQIDVKVEGDCHKLLEEMKGFHWMMSYGDYMRECGYALKKLGVSFLDVSASERT